MKIKKGDKVIVIAGKDKGKTSVVIKAMPSVGKVILEGVNIAKKHLKPKTQGSKGQIIDVAMPIDVSNVAIADPKTGKPTRVKIKRTDSGARVRIAVKSGAEIK